MTLHPHFRMAHIRLAVVALGLAPLIAFAGPSDSIQRCMDEFAAQNFPANPVKFVIEDPNRGPESLIAQTGTQTVQLVAEDASGRVISQTTCQVRNMKNREGQVIIMAPRDDEFVE